MEKSIAGQTLTALFIFMLMCVGGCLQVGNQAAPAPVAASGEVLSSKSAAVSIGGVALNLPLPAGYTEAFPALRQASAAAFVPPENIFGVYTPVADKGASRGEGLKLLQNRRLLIISARPELTSEAVGTSFYQAMQRDLARVNGGFSSERVAQFKVLTENYYARDDAFAHSLGVYAKNPRSTAIVRIVRQPSSQGEGAVSVYPRLAQDEGVNPVLRGWDRDYFSRAYYQVHIQNVMLLEGRCFNIHFFAPLASEEDLDAAMRENREYMNALAASLAGQSRALPLEEYGAAAKSPGIRAAEGN